MKHIKTVYEKEIFPQKETVDVDYAERLTAKAIVFDSEGMMAMIGTNANKYLLLPGGGVEEGEDYETGLHREMKEEIGCEIVIINIVGEIDDYRPRDKKHCITRCHHTNIKGEKGEPECIQEEIDNGHFVTWMSIESAHASLSFSYKELQEGTVEFYNTAFNILRDKLFLEEFMSEQK